MAEVRYACTEHHLVVVLDPDRRALSVQAVGQVHGGCAALTACAGAVPRRGDSPEQAAARLDAPTGPHGPLHPETGRPVCTIVRQDQVDAPTWQRAVGG